jgi:hypothetical protein
MANPVTHRDVEPGYARAAFQPATINDDARTVELVWTTGQRVQRGMAAPFWEELSLDPSHVRLERLANGAPLLDAHRAYDTRSVIGTVESVRLEGGRGVATVRFAEGDSVSDGIWRKVSQGILRNVSVGYRVHRFERLDEEGEGGLPVYRATSWEPMEISVVPIGADSGASIRHDGARSNRCEFFELAERDAMKNEKAVASAPESPAEQTPVDVEAIRAEERKAERERIETIQTIGTRLKVDDDFTRGHIAAGTTVADFRTYAIDMFAANDEKSREERGEKLPAPTGTIEAGDDERDKFRAAASDWIVVRSGVSDVVADADRRNGGTGAIDPGPARGWNFVDMARRCLERMGISTAGMDRQRLLGDAMTVRAGGMSTTSDFPVILENTLNKILLAAYAVTPDKWSQFCAVGSVSDFRVNNRLRMGSFGRLEKVNESGEFRNKSIPDARKETIQASTYGNIIGLSRQALINDDVSAFQRLATMLGRAARLSIEVDVFDLLKLNSGLGPLMADGLPLFDASHANLGAGAALSIDSIDENATVLAEQTDESGNEILDLMPYALVVPRGLQSQALNINGAEFNIDPDAAGSTKSRVPNVVRGMFERVTGTSRLTGTRRYLFASPNVAPTIEVVFLDGNQSPFLESRDGWTVDGVEWKVRLDYGVDAIDYRGAVTDAGA